MYMYMYLAVLQHYTIFLYYNITIRKPYIVPMHTIVLLIKIGIQDPMDIAYCFFNV